MTEVFSFEVSVTGTDWTKVINAHTAGKAKYEYWRDVTDPWPGVPFTAMRARKIGKPQSSEQFHLTATYRGFPTIHCGQRVMVGKGTGVIVGSNSAANFDILFDLDSLLFPGARLSVHPSEVVIV